MELKGCFKVPEEAAAGYVKKGEKQKIVGAEVGNKVPKIWDRVKKA